jgi:hypothetical protein
MGGYWVLPPDELELLEELELELELLELELDEDELLEELVPPPEPMQSGSSKLPS